MPLNWGLETLKWQKLVRKLENISFFNAYKAILAGITLSLFTPNRIGEYGGRILWIQSKKWKAIIATLVGSFSQLVILLSLGLLGMIAFIHLHRPIDQFLFYTICFCSLILIALLLLCYFNISLIIPVFNKIPFLRKRIKPFEVLANYESAELSEVLVYSCFRYLVYSLQYYFLLRFFGLEIHLVSAFICIALIFLIQTSIPLPPVLDLLVRGEIALNVWGVYSLNELSILSATFSLWIINLVIPSLIGFLFFIGLNLNKSLGIQKD